MIAVLGADGQLGRELLRVLGPRAIGFNRSRLRLGDGNGDALERALDEVAPSAVVNAAAFNAVDAAETERLEALATNSDGPAQLARLAAKRGWRLLHFSTDYVYGGDGVDRARVESDAPLPINFYGLSKLLGEEAVLRAYPGACVVRVAHLYGGKSLSAGRLNLVDRFLESARAGGPIRVTRGQWLNPTSVADLAPRCVPLLEAGCGGLYHLTGEGQCTAFEFAAEVLRLARLEAPVVEVERDLRPARRPLFTVLDNRRWREAGFPAMPHWRDGLARYVAPQ